MFKRGLSEQAIVYLTLAVLFIVFFVFSWLSLGTHGGGDDYTHYQIAHYAFEYPIKFLYHWGKPFYTLLIAPFAQFGFFGSKFFNLIIGILTAYFSYRIAKQLGFCNSLLVPFFVLFSPIYTVLVLSGMTEILFSFLLVLAAYLYLSNKSIFSAVVLSFLPFVRTEGVVILAVFAFVYLFYKNYKALPFLFTAYIVYSIVGYFAYGDINWVINQMPYGDASSIYGSGSLWHYVARTKSINGLPLGLLFLVGFAFLVWGALRSKISRTSTEVKQLLVVLAPAVVYYAAHSYVWWQGKGASMGLLRVMAGVMPLMAIVSLKGLNDFFNIIPIKPKLRRGITYIFLALVVLTPFRVYQIPVPLDEREKLVREAAEWLKSSEYYNHKILYFDPLVSHYGEFDPFDTNRCGIINGDSFQESVKLNEDELMVWDAGFGPVEGQLPKERLMNSPYLQLAKSFTPDIPFKVFGENYFEVLIFIPKQYALPQEVVSKLKSRISNAGKYKVLYYESFTSQSDSTIDLETNFNNAYKFDTSREFDLSFSIPFCKLTKGNNQRFTVLATARVYIPKGLNSENLSLCMSLTKGDETVAFNSVETKNMKLKAGEWHTIEHEMYLNEPLCEGMHFKVFFWNFHKNQYYIDDYCVAAIYRE
jgi:hypothetical protein